MVAPSNAATKCTSHLIPVSSSDVFDDSAFQGAFLSVDTSSSPQALINDRQSSFLYLVTQGADQVQWQTPPLPTSSSSSSEINSHPKNCFQESLTGFLILPHTMVQQLTHTNTYFSSTAGLVDSGRLVRQYGVQLN
jgi:hypothetical protein